MLQEISELEYKNRKFDLRKKVDKSSTMTILTIEEARSKIREILRGHGRTWPVDHCKARMNERNVQMDDILYCLSWGEVEYGREFGDRENNIFRVVFTDTEGEPLTLVVLIDADNNRLICKTVF
jgi:hypothetical protein